jgi:hypothetical protein
MGAKSNTSKHQILKLTCISKNCTFNVGDFSFFTQISYFYYQKIQIEVPSTKSNFFKCEGLHDYHSPIVITWATLAQIRLFFILSIF